MKLFFIIIFFVFTMGLPMWILVTFESALLYLVSIPIGAVLWTILANIADVNDARQR